VAQTPELLVNLRLAESALAAVASSLSAYLERDVADEEPRDYWLRDHLAALDHGHRGELPDLTDQLLPSGRQMALISRSALFSVEQVACLLQEIGQG